MDSNRDGTIFPERGVSVWGALFSEGPLHIDRKPGFRFSAFSHADIRADTEIPELTPQLQAYRTNAGERPSAFGADRPSSSTVPVSPMLATRADRRIHLNRGLLVRLMKQPHSDANRHLLQTPHFTCDRGSIPELRYRAPSQRYRSGRPVTRKRHNLNTGANLNRKLGPHLSGIDILCRIGSNAGERERHRNHAGCPFRPRETGSRELTSLPSIIPPAYP